MTPPPWLTRSLILRCILAISGTFSGLCAAVVISHGWSTGSHSPLLWGVAVAGGMVAVAAWGLAVLCRVALLESLWQRMATGLGGIPATCPRTTAPRAGAGLVLAGGLLFVVNTCWVLQHQDNPEDDDQGAYLITAREIHEQGGLPGLWRGLWSGEFAESNRHPLSLALLSLHPTVEFGRVITITGTSLLLAATLFVVWRTQGPLPAGVLAILLGTNGAWLYHAPRIVCESLLTGLAGLLWLSLFSSRPPSLSVEESPFSWRRASLSGGLAGLIYLTKGTGLLLIAGTGLAGLCLAVIERRDRSKWIKSLVGFSVALVLVSSPLLVRNFHRFGSPTYNVNSYLLWVDTYESPNAMADRMSLRDARQSYLATHSVRRLMQREVTGLAWEAFIGLRALGPAPWNDSRVLFGFPLFVAGLFGLFGVPRFPALVLLLWTGIIWGVMAWYVPIAAGDRFVMPLLIPWLTLAASGIVCSSLAGHLDQTVAVRRLVLAAMIWGIASTVSIWTRSELWAC